MKSKEEFDLGLAGIDTQYERDYINYRPRVKYAPPVVDGGNYSLSADTAGQEAGLGAIGDSSIVKVWEEVVEAIEAIDDLELVLSEKLEGVSVPVPTVARNLTIEAMQSLGYSGITDSIPFAVYKKTFENAHSPSAALIQDVFEDYMSDVHGTLNGELYADVAEMQNDWKDMQDFIRKGLFAQVVSTADAPTDLSLDNEALESVQEQEQALRDEYAQLIKLQTVSRQIYLQLSSSEYGSDRYYTAEKEYDDVKRELENLEKKLFTKAEVVDLVGRKASDTSDSIRLIGNAVDYDPYAADKYDLLYGLVRQFPTREAANSGLRKMQALLKLSVDGKKNTVDGMKLSLRGIAGQPTKRRVNRMLVNGIHLRNEVFREVYDIMAHLDGVPASRNFEVMLNHITDGVEQSELMYQSQASDFYKIHAMDAEIRMDKLGSVIDKDAARSVYKLLGTVLSYSKDGNSGWPSEENLSGWLSDFMEHSNID